MDFDVEPLSHQPRPLTKNPIPQSPDRLPEWQNNQQRPQRGYRNFFLITSGLILLAIGVFLLVFFRSGHFTEQDVELTIDGQREISSGTLVEYKVTYKNNTKNALENAQLTFFYPTDAIPFHDGEVVNNNTELLKLGTIDPASTSEKIFQAILVGDRGAIKNASANLTYTPQSIRSSFKKDATLSTTITSLAVPLTLVAPPNIVPNQPISYLLDYRNQSGEDLTGLRLVFDFPDGFRIRSAKPQPTSGTMWQLGTLKAGDGGRISVDGIIQGNQQENKSISVTLQKKIATPSGDKYVDFEKTQTGSVISTPPLSLDVSVNSGNDYVAHLGDNLQYSIRYANNSSVDIVGLTLNTKLDGAMFDISTVKSEGFFDSRTNIITWNSSAVSDFNTLRPGKSGTVTFNVAVKASFGGAVGASNSILKVSSTFSTPNVPDGIGVDSVSITKDLTTRISGQPSFTQTGLIRDEELGASGPFPPKLDQQTVFTVRWRITNPSNDLTGTRITAQLPPGVSWVGKTRVSASQPQPTYDDRSSIISWNVGTVPGGTGLSFPIYEADFQVAITPSVNQVGSIVTLLRSINFETTDSLTRENFVRSAIDLTTGNIADGGSNGIVVQ